MLTLTAQLDALFRAAIKDAFNLETDPQIGVGQNSNFGDYQSNAAMGLAKPISEREGKKLAPRQIAEQIKSHLKLGEIASEVTIAGPGFINVRLSPIWLASQLESVAAGDRNGVDQTTAPLTIVVDYSGPNIAKEMHVGHLRSTIIGDAISRIFEFQGHQVIRQNHIGDWGTQFGMLIQFMLEHEAAIGQIADLEDFYRRAKQLFDENPQFRQEAGKVVFELQSGSEKLRSIWQLIVNETRRHYQPLYEELGVTLRPENERGESFYNSMLTGVVADLKSKGIAIDSQGAVVVPVPGYEAPLMIQKSDGGYLYGTTDLAAIRYRTETLHARRIVYTHDSRQQQHFAQVFWTAEKAGWTRDVILNYAPFGTMLGEDGKPFKTRTGGTVKLKDLLKEAKDRAMVVVSQKNPELPADQQAAIAAAVSIGGIKYSDLAKDRISDYVFSFDKMLALDGNTAPYLQYAHARIRSIFRKAALATPEDGQTTYGAKILLESPHELALAKHILRFGESIDLVGRELKPHHLCTYLHELATRFSGFYENCPVLQSPEPTRSSRLAICHLAAQSLAKGLDLLGIEHPEQM